MTPHFLKRLAACLFLGLLLAPAHAQSPRPLVRATALYERMLAEGKYDELEKISNQARANLTPIEDGQMVLGALYDGVADMCNCRKKDPAQMQATDLHIENWRKAYPKSVAVEITSAQKIMARAWAARGGGYANTVTPEGWRLFREGMAAAEKRFMEMSPAARNDPDWYPSMLQIGVARQWPEEKYRALYLDAVKKHPTYLPIYFHASAYYTPRWGGTPETVRKFIVEAADLTRDKLGDTLYARLFWANAEHGMFDNGRVDWDRMKSGFERIVGQYPDAWNINNYARFACEARDYQALLKLDEKIKGQPIPDAWWGHASNYLGCMDGARQNKGQPRRPSITSSLAR